MAYPGIAQETAVLRALYYLGFAIGVGFSVPMGWFANRCLVGSGCVYETASKMACRIRLRSWDYWRIERSESGHSSGVVSNSVDAISWIRLAHRRRICLVSITSIGAGT